MVHKKVSGAGKNRRSSEVTIWESKESRPAAQVQGMGMIRELPIKIHVPEIAESPRMKGCDGIKSSGE